MPRRRARSKTAYQPLRHRLFYLLAAVSLTLGLVILKGGLTWAAERFVYSLPLVGGLLQSLELVEITNVVIFALLGVGLGAATRWLPDRWGLWRDRSCW